MTVSAIIHGEDREVISCVPTMGVSDAINQLANKRIGAMPVLDGDQVVGIFSERDAIYSLRDKGADMLSLTVGDVMTSDVVSVDLDKSAIGALSLMTKRRIRHLPVMDNGRMVAFISIGDLIKYRIDKIEAEADAMRDYIRMA